MRDIDEVRTVAVHEAIKQVSNSNCKLTDLKRVKMRLFDMDRIDTVEEQYRLLWNWCPVEYGYRILVYYDSCTVEGFSERDVALVLRDDS